MGTARVLITPELLAQAMSFPDRTAIVAAWMHTDAEGAQYVALVVEHSDLRAADLAGEPVPLATPRFRRDDAHLRPGVTFAGWGQD